MTEINKLENEIRNFGGIGYSVSENGRGEKTYTIHSETLKQSLRNIIYSKVSLREEWIVGHSFGQDAVEYSMERDGKFGFYRKSMGDSNDEFTVITGSATRNPFSLAERKRDQVLRSIRQDQENRKRFEKDEQRFTREKQGQQAYSGNENYVSAIFRNDENGKLIVEKAEARYNDPAEIQTGWGFDFTKNLLSKWNDEGIVNFSNQNNSSTVASLENSSQQVSHERKRIERGNERQNISGREESRSGDNKKPSDYREGSQNLEKNSKFIENSPSKNSNNQSSNNLPAVAGMVSVVGLGAGLVGVSLLKSHKKTKSR